MQAVVCIATSCQPEAYFRPFQGSSDSETEAWTREEARTEHHPSLTGPSQGDWRSTLLAWINSLPTNLSFSSHSE